MGEAPGPLTADDQTMSGLESTPSQRWLARLSFVLAGPAIVILAVFAGLKSLAMLAVGLAPRDRPGIPAPKPPMDWARRSGHRFEWR
jgi:hypothetical protein